MILGVDPGVGGAAALVSDKRVIAWWAWTWLKDRGGRYRLRTPEGTLDGLASQHDIAVLISLGNPRIPGSIRALRYRLVLEGLYVGRGRGRRARSKQTSVISLAESAGELIGPLRGQAIDIRRPTYGVWSAKVLGLPSSTPAKLAEEYAVAEARRKLDWVCDPSTLTRKEEGAVSEAACMTMWGA